LQGIDQKLKNQRNCDTDLDPDDCCGQVSHLQGKSRHRSIDYIDLIFQISMNSTEAAVVNVVISYNHTWYGNIFGIRSYSLPLCVAHKIPISEKLQRNNLALTLLLDHLLHFQNHRPSSVFKMEVTAKAIVLLPTGSNNSKLPIYQQHDIF
jgi:hypothetical protein